jgi:hypothetical protein
MRRNRQETIHEGQGLYAAELERLGHSQRTCDLYRMDPARAAEAVIEAVQSSTPPLHLVLGRAGFDNVENQLKSMLQEVERWKPTTSHFPYKSLPRFAPSTCRMSLGQYQDIHRTDPEGRVNPRF